MTGAGQYDGSGITQDTFDLRLKGRREIGHNQDRDTIFGEPFFIVFPGWSGIYGDVMVLFQIAGTNPDVAEEVMIRTFNQQGNPRYILVRVQYQDQVIEDGDTSCMILPSERTEFCGPGYTLPAAFLSAWDDFRREHKMQASREKMLVLMNMPEFQRPLRVYLQGGIGTGVLDSEFMDGALTIDDIKTPSLPPEQEFFQ